MSWSTPTTPNLNDYCAFVLLNMGIDPLYLPNVLPPAAAGLTAGSGGSLVSGTTYVKLTYVSALGETQGSPEASVAVTGPTGSVTVTPPSAPVGATGYNVYAGLATGIEQLQNSSPIALGTPFVLTVLISGVVCPNINTAGSPWLGYSFMQAQGLVLNFPGMNSGLDYTLAIYNCAGHVQIKISPDQIVGGISRKFFQEQRATYDLLKQSVGVVQSTSNSDTSTTIAVPDSLKQLTLTDLEFIKTPWGRSFLQYQQDYGPSIWAVS